MKKIEYMAGLGGFELPEDIELCDYNHDCHVRQDIKRMPYCSLEQAQDCRIYQFHKKWGDKK